MTKTEYSRWGDWLPGDRYYVEPRNERHVLVGYDVMEVTGGLGDFVHTKFLISDDLTEKMALEKAIALRHRLNRGKKPSF